MSRSVCDFRIVYADDFDTLSALVVRAIDDGWELYGDHVVSQFCVSQSMVLICEDGEES